MDVESSIETFGETEVWRGKAHFVGRIEVTHKDIRAWCIFLYDRNGLKW